MDARLQTLLDKDAVADTVHRLFVATDRRDWDAVADCFAGDVRFDMTSPTGGEPVQRTPREIVDGWTEGLRRVRAIHHQAGNLMISVNGDGADAFCYGTASHWLPNPTGRDTRVFVGSHDFHLVRQGERWRIGAFRFDCKYVDGNPNLEADAEGTA